MDAVVEYMRRIGDGRTIDPNNIYCVQMKEEPLMFSCHFLGWEFADQPDSTDSAGMRGRAATLSQVRAEMTRKIPYEELRKRPPPPGLDMTRLESYLTDEEFEAVFNMRRAQFAKLPEWARLNKKREVNL